MERADEALDVRAAYGAVRGVALGLDVAAVKSQLYVGVRTALTITVLRKRYMVEEGSFGLVGWYRGDVAVARPKAFDIVRGVRP